MDTSEYPSISQLAKLHMQLASESRRIETVIDSMLDGIERLLSANAAQDWQAIADASRELASLDPNSGNEEIVRQAQSVCEELQSPHQAYMGRPRHLPQLLAACRAARTRPVAVRREPRR